MNDEQLAPSQTWVICGMVYGIAFATLDGPFSTLALGWPTIARIQPKFREQNCTAAYEFHPPNIKHVPETMVE